MVKRSVDGVSWGNGGFLVTTGEFGYSCLATLPSGPETLGLLWETQGRTKLLFTLVPANQTGAI